MSKVHVKTNDTVIVISGDDKGKKGKVIAVSPKEVEGAIYASKVQHYCAKCDKAVRAKAAEVDGKKVKVCAKCGAEL